VRSITKWAMLLVIIVAGLALFACGDEDESSETATATPEAAATAAPAAEATNTPVVRSGPKDVILSTTTSVQDTGLLDVLLVMFKEETGYNVKPIAVGTGQALAMGERGDADVMMVHAPPSEKKLIDNGTAIDRRLVAHNYFVLLGPDDDPAGAKSASSAADALEKIYDAGATFISRGDDSGTHKKELLIWDQTGLDPKGQPWYKEAGQGMAATLQIANQQDAYTLCDKATYLSQKKNISLVVVVETDPMFLNVYSVMLVNPEKFDMVNADGAKAFADFIVSEEAQKVIGEFGVEEYGQPLFIPDADKTYEEVGLDTPFG
jgi:tungstate transport system substrate-binding protein